MPPEDKLLRVVVDTNVLFSALAFPAESPPARVFKLIVDGKVLAFSSPFIVDELEKNLRTKAGWGDEQLRVLRRRLKLTIRLVAPKPRLSVIKRIEADNRILECAVDAHANVLITGNLKDLRPLGAFQGIAILTPREFLTRYFPK
jgi:putative PIN family toxin of toxin-antitoxin system